MVKTVSVRGTDVKVKNVCIKDDTDSIRVSLWREFSDACGVGRYLTLSNVVVGSYNNQATVSTTVRTTIKVNKKQLNYNYNNHYETLVHLLFVQVGSLKS